jgi:hypothetical protein
VYAPPRIVNASQVRTAAGVGFAAPFAPLDSALYSFVPQLGLQGCMAQAALAQVCGGALVPALGRALGGCAGDAPCCLLNPYKGCALGAGEGPWGNATLFVFGDSGVFPELASSAAGAAGAHGRLRARVSAPWVQPLQRLWLRHVRDWRGHAALARRRHCDQWHA